MSNKQYTIDNTDVGAETFVVPGKVSSDTSVDVETSNLDNGRQWYTHVVNGFDVSIDVTAQGTHYLDGNMNSPVDDGTTETISSGSNGAFDGNTGHSYIRVEVTTAADPTSGSLVVTFQSREE